MKRLMLVAAIAASFAVQAAEVARVKNNDGGYIVFTASYCGNSNETFSVYGYGTSSNNTVSGCYIVKDSAFWVIWNGDTNVKRYPADSVSWHPDFIESMKKQRQTY